MPKTSHGGGATAAGMEGVVVDARDRRWELDPERNLDGTLVEGEHPDHENGDDSERDVDTLTVDNQPRPQGVSEYEMAQGADAQADRERSEREHDERAHAHDDREQREHSEREQKEEVATSPGTSSSTQGDSTPSTPSKTGPKRR